MKNSIYAAAFACLLVAHTSSADEGITKYETLGGPSGESISYAVHLPPGFDKGETYPVLIGPGDGVKGAEAGFYWRTDQHSNGWIIVDAQLWEPDTKQNLDLLLDTVLSNFNVEGGKFHSVCWSANSAGIFSLVTDHASRFHSITGMAGNPRSVTTNDIEALRDVKIQFVVGENDRSWQRSAKSAHDKLQAGGIDSILEIVPGAGHVMTDLVGEGFMQRLEKLR